MTQQNGFEAAVIETLHCHKKETNMSTITQTESNFFARKNSMMYMEQRGFYFTIGFGLILVAMVDPLESMMWVAVINIIGLVLVTLSVLGKRLLSTQKESGLWLEPRQITSSVIAIIGVGLSVLAIANPPTSTTLAAYIHIFGIVLVIHAILGFDSFLKSRPDGLVYKFANKTSDVKTVKRLLGKAA